MDIDLLTSDPDKIAYSDIIKRVTKRIDNMYLSSSDFSDCTKVKQLMKEWYLKGYFQALDEYRILAR